MRTHLMFIVSQGNSPGVKGVTKDGKGGIGSRDGIGGRGDGGNRCNMISPVDVSNQSRQYQTF